MLIIAQIVRKMTAPVCDCSGVSFDGAERATAIRLPLIVTLIKFKHSVITEYYTNKYNLRLKSILLLLSVLKHLKFEHYAIMKEITGLKRIMLYLFPM